MFFVVVLHNVGQGQMLAHVQPGTVDWWGINLLENLAIVAVNLFAMITGYLGMGRPPKTKRVIGVVLQTIFWAVVITALALAVGMRLTPDQLLHFTLPIFGFWYVRAYLGLMLLSPILHLAVRNLAPRTYARMVIALIVVSVTLGWLNQFYLLSGYSAYWLIVMYLIGAYLQIAPLRRQRALAYWLTYLAMAVLTALGQYLLAKMGHGSGSLRSYVAPLVVVESIALMKAGLCLQIRNTFIQQSLKTISSVAFGVYLIDAAGVMYNIVLPKLNGMLLSLHGLLWLAVIIESLLMFVVFLGADWLRAKLFQFCQVERLIAWLDLQAKAGLDQLSRLLQV